jgi:hypothetical protein
MVQQFNFSGYSDVCEQLVEKLPCDDLGGGILPPSQRNSGKVSALVFVCVCVCVCVFVCVCV